MLFLGALFVSFVSPVYAVTLELTSPQASAMPISKNLAMTTQTPEKKLTSEFIGPTKPEGIADKPSTPTPSPTVVPLTPTPTISQTPTPTIAPTTQPTQVAQTGSNTSNGGLNAEVLFSMSNNYRASKGLAPFQTDARVCSLAAARAPQIAAEIAGGYMHAGMNSHNFPYRFTENIVTMRTEAEAFNFWLNDGRVDQIHRVQIEANNTHSCVACAGNACAQEFTSFKTK